MNNPLHQRQADARALVFLLTVQPLEHAEQLIDVLHVESDTVVPDGKGFFPVLNGHADFDSSLVAPPCVFYRIGEQIGKNLFQHCAVGLHVGFVPHDAADPMYAEVLAVTRELCDHCRANQQNLHLETGQEAADTLLRFLGDVGRDNLFVNFDPANMILYGSGEPIEALRKVSRYVRSVHCKDAKWAARPGQEWGREVPLGEGDVGMENFLRTLSDLGYAGPLTIEREIPQEPSRQKEEIGRGIRLLNQLKAKIG